MSEPQEDLLQEMAKMLRKFQPPGGDFAPLEDRNEWDQLVESQSPEESRLLKELASFADLWKYFQNRGEKLGAQTLQALSEVPKLPVAERIVRLREINQRLMERVSDAGKRA